jgi:hypothetical protein
VFLISEDCVMYHQFCPHARSDSSWPWMVRPGLFIFCGLQGFQVNLKSWITVELFL